MSPEKAVRKTRKATKKAAAPAATEDAPLAETSSFPAVEEPAVEVSKEEARRKRRGPYHAV